MTLAVGAWMAYIATQGWRSAGAEWYIKRAEQFPNFSAEQLGALKQAQTYEPRSPQIAYNIGECLRIQSWEGGDNYVDLAQQANIYYAQAAKLNRTIQSHPSASGWLWTGLGGTAKLRVIMPRRRPWTRITHLWLPILGGIMCKSAIFSAARQYFIRANNLSGLNEIAKNYLFNICEPKLIERASGQLPIQLFYPGNAH